MTKQKNSSSRSLPFRKTREHHGSEAAEDYTELIYELISTKGEARTCEIAKLLGVSHVTAVKTIRRLQEEGYLETSRNKPVVLTPKGEKLATYSKARHELLVDFFVHIGVPRNLAEIDVEGAEHHFSKETLRVIEKFLNKK